MARVTGISPLAMIENTVTLEAKLRCTRCGNREANDFRPGEDGAGLRGLDNRHRSPYGCRSGNADMAHAGDLALNIF